MELNLEVNKTVLDYYTNLTSDYDSGNIRPPEIILPTVPDIPVGCSTPSSSYKYLLPSVILWDPLQQLECFKNGIRCPYDAHGDEEHLLEPRKSRKGAYRWQAGSRISLSPRQLSSSSWPAVLLSRLYFCKSKTKHRSYIAHDPEILSMIASSETHLIPFVLLHRTGFTKELCETVTSLVSSGMTLGDIEQVIYQQHITNFAQCKAKWEEDTNMCLQNDNSEVETPSTPFPEYKPVGVPSMEMILGSLLDNFQERQIYYNQRMSELSAKVLLMGHFYKASQQMGIVGPKGKWVPKYGFIFTVANEKGQVIAWQVTRGTNFKNVSLLLENVHQRLVKQGVTIEFILTPECCVQKDFLSSIFGSNVQIKMDPKFANRKLEKRFRTRKGDHDHMLTCLQSFNLVFHKSTDLGSERCEETASSELIVGNLDSFISQWKNVRGETKERLLHEPALRELNALKCCVNNGCLSDIPPDSGGKYIDELREYLHTILHRRFLNTDLAIPALTALFYCWNERHSGKEDDYVTIGAYKAHLDADAFVPTTEQFGDIENPNKPDGKDDNSVTSLTLDLLPIQHLLFAETSQEPLMDANTSTLNLTTQNKVLSQAENSYIIFQTLKSLCLENPPVVNLWHYHLLPCCALLFSRSDCPIEDKCSLLRLQENVDAFGGTLLGEVSDPDGFFVALTWSLNNLLNFLEVESPTDFHNVKEHLVSIGYNVEDFLDENSCVTVLRQIISAKWMQHKDSYSKLLTTQLLDFAKEAELFVNKGYYQAEMVNILPIVAVQVFRIPLIIFTSMESFPIVPITPTDKPLVTKCLFMGYSSAEFGSYYTVSNKPSKPSEKSKHVCRCGLGNSKNREERGFCIQVHGRYMTRCECFRNGFACSHLCRCFNCANPQGTSTESRSMHSSQKTRLRSRHKLQQMRRPPVLQCDESHWEIQECLLFQSLIDALKFTESLPLTMEASSVRVLKEFQSLQRLGPMQSKEKTLDDVKQHLKIFLTNLETFQALYSKQSDQNWAHSVNPVNVDMSDENQLVVIVESSE